ncbi:MAG: right-handed parallel beta-helix repeat-containing protein [Acidobacteria bacterium]|nr:right-handed parallel beta-helix repeat-containing protein [Acidobacteriota bacterium]
MLWLALLLSPPPDEAALRALLQRASGLVTLPAGVIEITRELVLPEGAHDLEIRGAPEGTVLRAAAGFQGRAVLSLRRTARVRLAGFTIDGNRAALEKPLGLPPHDLTFARFYPNNGILAEDSEAPTIEDVKLVNVTNLAVLITRCRTVRIRRLHLEDCGSRDAQGRNNTTGGILFEDGTADFEVRDSVFRRIRGNGVWTHSRYTSPRNSDGLIAGNRFQELARDAIQVGHATRVRVERNRGTRIGYPLADVDPNATPVAIDTAGNTDRSVYAHNRFEEVNGKCIDLDGFHHGEVLSNTCINRRPRQEYPHGHFGIVLNNTNPDMQSEEITISGNHIEGAVYGGIFVIGSRHRIVGNRLLDLNQARCEPSRPGCLFWPDEPELLSSGIYLGQRAERPAITKDNLIENNEIAGCRMRIGCIAAAPGVSLRENRIGENGCMEGDSRKPESVK